MLWCAPLCYSSYGSYGSYSVLWRATACYGVQWQGWQLWRAMGRYGVL
jgi:hypothetical protein